MPGEKSAKRRADDKAQSKGGANQTHALRAFRRFGDVGNIGLRSGNIAGTSAGKGARSVKHPQRRRVAEP